MKRNLQYEFHHFGIPLQDGRCEGTFSEKAGMFTSDNPGNLKSSGIALLTTHHFILY